jgi:hypothetical protein
VRDLDSSDDSGSESLYSDAEVAAPMERLESLAQEGEGPWDLLQRMTAARLDPAGRAAPTPAEAMVERALSYEFTDDKSRFGAIAIGQRFSSANGDWPPAFDSVLEDEKEL